MIQAPDVQTLKGRRDRAILALMLGCGLRRGEVADLRMDRLQQREGHWVIADLVGKAAHIRTVPVPARAGKKRTANRVSPKSQRLTLASTAIVGGKSILQNCRCFPMAR